MPYGDQSVDILVLVERDCAVGAAVHLDGGPSTGQLWGVPNINVAPANMEDMVASVVSHPAIGWLNAEAEWNIHANEVLAPTSHCPIGWLNAEAL